MDAARHVVWGRLGTYVGEDVVDAILLVLLNKDKILGEPKPTADEAPHDGTVSADGLNWKRDASPDA